MHRIIKHTFLDSSAVEHSAVNRRVVGSNPSRGVWLHGQAVMTSPFHGGNTGSIPVGVIMNKAPWPSGKAKVCNTSITSSNLVGASKKKLKTFVLGFFMLLEID